MHLHCQEKNQRTCGNSVLSWSPTSEASPVTQTLPRPIHNHRSPVGCDQSVLIRPSSRPPVRPRPKFVPRPYKRLPKLAPKEPAGFPSAASLPTEPPPHTNPIRFKLSKTPAMHRPSPICPGRLSDRERCCCRQTVAHANFGNIGRQNKHSYTED